ncbi:MAG TPA: hypothetical protein VJB87_02900 [Candidatus Nanoarchaeia archaeon]|nr:hypothetical protein [Candidatus Nanoarchaeia archaeon]
MVKNGNSVVDLTKGFISLKIIAGKMYCYNDSNQVTEIYGFIPKSELVLPYGATYFGFVSSGEIRLLQELPQRRERVLYGGGFFFCARFSKNNKQWTRNC